ncbi:MAG: hypothetical protein ACI90Y_002063 [Polaromonas sp.]
MILSGAFYSCAKTYTQHAHVQAQALRPPTHRV